MNKKILVILCVLVVAWAAFSYAAPVVSHMAEQIKAGTFGADNGGGDFSFPDNVNVGGDVNVSGNVTTSGDFCIGSC